MMILLTDALAAGHKKELKQLYLSAFPAAERKPIWLIWKKYRENTSQVFAIENEEGEFLGLAITLVDGDLVILDYFAVREDVRNAGVGAQAIRALQKQYQGKNFLLEIESTLREQSTEMEKRRKAFYLRNGMTPMNYIVDLFGVEMEILTAGTQVSFERYHKALESVYSKAFGRNVRKVRDLI